MYIPIGPPPDNDFHNPLGLLSDCHRRIERFLDALVTVAEQAKPTKLSSLHRRTLAHSLTYFREAAPLHVKDEEDSLFPRLQNEPNARRALDWLKHLQAEHEQADLWHLEIECLGQEWLSDGTLSEQKRRRFLHLVKSLYELYVIHIKLEEERVFPLASVVLSPEQVTLIGYEMASRRDVSFQKIE